MLILVRHGRTPANAAGLLQGRIDQDLDEHGERQAAAVARHVEQRYGVDAVISSPLKRAVQTADAFGRPVSIDDRWIELAYGVYEGTSPTSVPSEVWRRWRYDPHFVPEGGEPLVAVERRVREACTELLERANDEHVVVVSHVSPIKSAVAWVLGGGVAMWSSCYLDHAAICRIDVHNDRPVLIAFNETVAVEV